jgi:hypothetical protein
MSPPADWSTGYPAALSAFFGLSEFDKADVCKKMNVVKGVLYIPFQELCQFIY